MIHMDKVFDHNSLPPIPFNPENYGTQSEVISTGKSIINRDLENVIKKSKLKYFIGKRGKIWTKPTGRESLFKSAIMVPIRLQGKVAGVIQILSINKNAYTPAHLRFLEAFSPQIAAAIANANLFDKAQSEIAERKKTEEALQLTKYSIDKVADAITWVDMNGNFMEVNDAACKLFNLSKEDFLNHSVFDFDITASKKSWSVFRDKLKIDDSDLSQTEIKVGDKRFISVEILANYLVFEGKEHIVGIVRNITERKRVNDEILKAKQQIQNIFDRLDNVFWSYDVKYKKLLQISPACLKIFGRTQDEFYSNPFLWYEVTHTDDKHHVKIFNASSIEGLSYTDQFRIIHKNGEVRWIENSIKLTRDGNGELINIDGITTDITDQVRASEALKKSEERFKDVAENAGEWIWEVNVLGLYTYSSPAVEKILGYKPDEIVGKKHFYDFFQPETKEYIKEIAFKTFEKKEPFINLINQNIHKNGSVIILETNGAPILDEHGNLLGYRGADKDVTEKIHAEEALKQSEERYQALFDRSLDIVYLHDFQGNFLDVNASGLNLFGYSREDIPFVNISKLMDSEQLLKAMVAIEEVIKLGFQKEPTEFLVKTKDGRSLNIETKASLIFRNGVPFAIQGIGRDVTERKKVQEELLESELKYRTLFEGMSEGLLKTDSSETILFVNDQFCRILGYSKEELIGKKSYDILIREEDYQIIKKKNHEREQGLSDKYELRLKHKSGKLIWAEISASPSLNINGRISGSVSLVTDITERIQTEVEIRKLSRAVEQSMVSIIITDANGNIEYGNPEFTKISGYSLNEVLGKNPKIFQSGKTNREIYKAMWESIISGNEWRGEFLNKKKNGELYWEYISISPIKDELGEITHFLAIKEDITEKKQKDEQLKESLKEKEIMLREIHHRVKNNLQVISSLLKLQSSYIKDPKVLEYFQLSQDRIRAMGLIHQQLYRSTHFSSINFQDYITSLTNDLFYIYQFEKRRIGLNIKAHNIILNLETAIPCGLLINELVSNSLKHAFIGLDAGNIDIALFLDENDKFNLIVKDNGNGIREDFDFENPKTLGLELITSLVEQIDGNLEMNNHEGTEFKITFSELKYKQRM